MTTLKKVKMPAKKSTPAALDKYNKALKLYKMLNLKKELGYAWNSGDELKLVKAGKRLKKYKKAAAPLLVKLARDKRAARGRGKKRGIGSNIMKSVK